MITCANCLEEFEFEGQNHFLLFKFNSKGEHLLELRFCCWLCIYEYSEQRITQIPSGESIIKEL